MFMKWAEEVIKNPEACLKAAKTVLETGFKYINSSNEQLKKFENEAKATRQEGDRLEAMVHANWQGIKKCNSDDEYLQEEERMAKILEEKILQQHQAQQQKHIGS